MTQEHPITPPPELVKQWREMPEYASISEKLFTVNITTNKLQDIATQAARWGADQELEACCEYEATVYSTDCADGLRRHRRPEPPSLKEQALAALDEAVMRGDCITVSDALRPIRRALESLPD
jgi:hypothetical protein